GRVTMDWITLFVRNISEVVDRLADYVHHTTERPFAHRYCDRTASVGSVHAAHHAIGWQHRHGADAAFAQVLLHFGNNVDGIGNFETVRSDAQCLVNWRQVFLTKFNVNYRANNLHDLADVSVRAVSIWRSHICSINSSNNLMRSLTERQTGRVLKGEKIT